MHNNGGYRSIDCNSIGLRISPYALSVMELGRLKLDKRAIERCNLRRGHPEARSGKTKVHGR
jgi:hypothetical protein